MSTHWHIRCVTCQTTHHFNDANHCEKLMWTLTRHAALISELRQLMEADTGGVDIEFRTYYGSIDTAWFAKHRDHVLVPIDEYGRLATQCQERVDCAHCGSSKNCVLDAGHPAPCAPTRPKVT